MSTTAEQLLAELENAATDLFKWGNHEGDCTNANQMKLVPKVAPCTKHAEMLKKREKRFKEALQNFKLLRDVFGTIDA
jgi:hypothetical protein